ncbi:mannosyl-glycoendo-beta-N-acetylglucosaminidase family protein [Lapidilactobacillus dextrinicus DSM 20335]|uniref:Mannosyl-glycoendo-beta-N-acetylglucosaminidase family protein n=1 Tax=Lapidilactobacillus dextrinicus DSM 20335 TaxID=1423738 RepID=A0A0R2BH38_9LACO|nr:glycoside hydrolase family 73 protein [Lapidilactobacillus dextrinicus]KRM78567.1 mannosyl-glycoendo-beta-N-acetylglucosaminidase family protein [Lapidilactobacillus dextrinicus DSM 20335]QFG46116.1 N-acetylmuramidase [Lapidilactobacillus dextrinicus]
MTKRRSSHNFFQLGITNLGLIIIAIIISAVLLLALVDRQQATKPKEATTTMAQSTNSSEKQDFIDKVAPEAVQLKATYQVLPSITIAQAILESDWGQSQLTAKYNNLFGVKGDRTENTKEMTTQEYLNGEWKTVTARFRVYASYRDSLLEHAQLFHKGTTWNANQYQHFLAAKNYQEAAKALETDGYATDPGYAEKLIELIQQYHLDDYDKQ